MRLFTKNEFVRFFRAVDRGLPEPFRLDIIGEAVAILMFHAKSGTSDVDATTNVAPLEELFVAARAETGLDVDVGTTSVYDTPYNYESRVKRVHIPGLKKLQIFAPEKHDWALIKMTRLLEKDLEDIEEVYREVGFNKNIFMKRFLLEMTHVTGRREDLIYNFLTMMEELFGTSTAERAEKAIATHKLWRT